MVDLEKLSYGTRKMLADRKGYRNDFLYGSGIEDIRKVIRHEADELCNADIFITCENLYGIDYGEINVEDIENIDGYVEKTMEFLKSHFGTDELYGKWLALKEDIMTLYRGEEGITEYIIPENAIVISDIGRDGALFVTPNAWDNKSDCI